MDFSLLNNKAKEAWAKSRIELGNGLLKAIFIGFMLLPATLILKSGIEGNQHQTKSLIDVLQNLPNGSFLSVILIFSGLTAWGVWLVSSSIKMLNQINE